MSWSFAIVNRRLAEIFFNHQKGETVFRGHSYARKKEYTTKTEQKWIKIDTAKYQFIYRKGQYRDLRTGKIFKTEAY